MMGAYSLKTHGFECGPNPDLAYINGHVLGSIISWDLFSLGIIRGVAAAGRAITTASLRELRMGRGKNSSAQIDHLAVRIS